MISHYHFIVILHDKLDHVAAKKPPIYHVANKANLRFFFVWKLLDKLQKRVKTAVNVADNVNLLAQIFSFAPNFSLLNLKIKIVNC